MTKKVSIIIPVFKTEKYIQKCVDSCISQTYTNIEIIIIDDGSPDNAGFVCDQLAEKDDRIIVIHKDNEGVSVARNVGIEMATGEYIVFVDSDDWLEYNMIEKMISLTDLDTDLVICGSMYHYNEKKVIVIPPKCTVKSSSDILSHYLDRNYSRFLEAPWAKLYKMDVIKLNSIRFDKTMKLGEDLLFNLMLIKYYNNIKFINIPLYHFRRITYDKKAHYKSDNLDYQWENNLKIYNVYKSELGSIVEKDDIGKMSSFYLRSIKAFIDTTLSSKNSLKCIIHKLKDISKNEEFSIISKIRFQDASDPVEKIVLFFCKIKCWLGLCMLFRIKQYIHKLKIKG